MLGGSCYYCRIIFRSKPKLKILHISKYDNRGGAAKAARSSMLAQRASGYDSQLLAGRKLDAGDHIFGPAWLGDKVALMRFAGERIPMILSGTPKTETRSIGVFGIRVSEIEKYFRPDIVVLHNIDGLIRLETLKDFTVPIVWRLHDMWAFSGTAHYSGKDWAQGPGRLLAMMERLDQWTFNRKRHAINKANISFLSPSKWLADEAAKVFPELSDRIFVVPNGVNTTQFAPLDKLEARNIVGVDPSKFVILFGAVAGKVDARKGFDLLVESLLQIPRTTGLEKFQILTFGGDGTDKNVAGIPCVALGSISDRAILRAAYSAADMTIVPSREENLSLTVLESLSCGTPVAAFNIGGMPDMIRHGKNGWLVPAFETAKLAETIASVSREPEILKEYRVSAREIVIQEFAQSIECSSMLAVLEKILYERQQQDLCK